ncbi:hypothetical protein PENSPDRAFT_657683 [Peniophora sp. CONT]|nr:hypothetical protein PENSPDRAFT_657683 [Peniophora sp. CONT]
MVKQDATITVFPGWLSYQVFASQGSAFAPPISNPSVAPVHVQASPPAVSASATDHTSSEPEPSIPQPTKKKSKKHKKQKDHQRVNSDTPLDDFFSTFEGFKYDPRRSTMDEFYRLCDERGWPSKNPPPERITARNGLKTALIRQFAVIFGTELNSLRSWQLLCTAVGLEDVPKTLPECRKIVEEVYVNLVDLIDKMRLFRMGETFSARLFPDEKSLSAYTLGSGKTLPLDQAHGLLGHLLRHIEHPRSEAQSNLPRFTGESRSKAGGANADALHNLMEGLTLS